MPLTITGILVVLFSSLPAGPIQPVAPANMVSIDLIESADYDRLIAERYSPPAETLSFVIQAGEVLIFNLPLAIEGRQIDSYKIKESPALSWLTGRSFFWRTLAKDAGKHEIMLTGLRNGVATEEILIQVDIR